MLFSEQFNVTMTGADDWFNPILFTDTKLFIDPFLILNDEKGAFMGSHAEIVQFFDFVFKLIAKSSGNVATREWQHAIVLLELGEVHELCIGYTGSGTRGAGSGRGMATQIARGLLAAVRQGVAKLEHFEEVQIFEEGIGADRISDATASILRSRLARYTEAVAERHRVPTQEIRYLRFYFDPTSGRWHAQRYKLPLNPYTNDPILLVPKDYLRALPTINPGDFWDYCFNTENEIIIREFGDEISRNVDKATFVQFAKRHPDLRERYVKSKELEGGEAYDLRTDPHGYYQPFFGGRGWASSHPVHCSIETADDLFQAVFPFAERFRNYVENNEGWRLLWNDDETPKKRKLHFKLYSQAL